MNLSQGYSSGGSVNSARNFSDNMSQSWSQANAWTDAISARQWSALQAEIAWQRDMEAMQTQMDFNAAEAQKVRDWQEQMANTIYTRSVKNMREAGINPILAANMGLSGAQVGSGATASLGGVPSAPLAQSFMDSWSASSAGSFGNGHSEGWSEGSSWNSSENGLVTALTALGGIVSDALGAISSSNKIEIALSGIDEKVKELKRNAGEHIAKNKSGISIIDNLSENLAKKLGYNGYIGGGGGHGF